MGNVINQFGDEAECFARHLGVWAVRPEWLRAAIEMFRADKLPLRGAGVVVVNQVGVNVEGAEAARRPPGAGAGATAESAEDERPYSVVDGVAIVPIVGSMMKGDSKFGGTVNTVRVRRMIRAAGADSEVGGILLRIESPGGHVAGTDELARDVARSAKPVWAHVEDIGASAAYWVASQARRITANRVAEIGSIGVFGVVQDYSELYKREGVTVHVVTSGGVKGMGVQGTPIKAEYLEELQGQIEAIHAVFTESVASGRKMSTKAARELGDGRVHIASRAQELGLVDEVTGFEETLAGLAAVVQGDRKVQEARRRLAGAR